MPGPKQRRLTPAEIRRLVAAARAIEDAQRRWAEVVRDLGPGGYSAVARHLELTPDAIRNRVKKALG